MPDYITIPITIDPETLTADKIATLQALLPGWLPNDGNVETIMLEAQSRIDATIGELASRVSASIFRYFGGSLVNVIPLDAAAASAQTTWTVRDAAGYTIRAGTPVGIRTAGDTVIPFAVAADLVIPPGSTTGVATIVAINKGTAASGLGTPGGPVELIAILDWVTGITQVAATSGGADAETDDAYLGRLRGELQLDAPRPIVARDFAVFAQNVAGVARALAIDGYNPSGATYGNERMVTVAVVDADGLALSGGVKTAVEDYLEARREITFEVHVIDPTYTTINVAFSFTTRPGFLAASVKTAAEAAVTSFLSPANWGLADTGLTLSGALDPMNAENWTNKPTVDYLDLGTELNQVPGLDRVTVLTLAANPAALTSASVSLAGVAPLPLPGTVVGTAV